jgi:hypothetical protein
VPPGQAFEVTLEEGKTFRLALTEIYRGQEAWDRILAANQFNDPPPAGQEYLLVHATVDYLAGPEAEALMLDQWDWRLVSRAQILRPPSVVKPEPAFDLAFFPGARGAGWMAWLVHEDEPDPLLVIGMEYDGSGGTYFALAPQAGP